ncbi:hypothetical protein N7447_005322 [Penicillium robsamsonii]|uniref:uncharacterized protein n=1 Tax=Penicillium robsamsonii TaxID=1792511 RepID=UPI002548F838|nr:uncharacterized protein N7447_005322 [Penicillium robsamsonii]KAJ5822982.1 hypothetical protein N7447_005322 [Penicillium robsamsonii]
MIEFASPSITNRNPAFVVFGFFIVFATSFRVGGLDPVSFPSKDLITSLITPLDSWTLVSFQPLALSFIENLINEVILPHIQGRCMDPFLSTSTQFHTVMTRCRCITTEGCFRLDVDRWSMDDADRLLELSIEHVYSALQRKGQTQVACHLKVTRCLEDRLNSNLEAFELAILLPLNASTRGSSCNFKLAPEK